MVEMAIFNTPYCWCSTGCDSKGMLTRVMVLVFCMSSHGALHLCEISWKYLKRFSTYRADMGTWWKWLCSIFKGQNLQSRQTRVMVYVFCLFLTFTLSFVKISRTVSEFWSRHEYMVDIAMFNVQRVIIPSVGKSELWFMCSAHRLMVLYIGVKFRENISNGIRVMERTQNYKALTDGGTLKISDGIT